MLLNREVIKPSESGEAGTGCRESGLNGIRSAGFAADETRRWVQKWRYPRREVAGACSRRASKPVADRRSAIRKPAAIDAGRAHFLTVLS